MQAASIPGQTQGAAAFARPRAAPLFVPLFHAAWLFAVGIAVSRWMYLRPPLVLIGVVLLAIVVAVAAIRAQRMVWLPMGAVWVALGAWCAAMEPAPAPSSTLLRLSDGLARTVEGTVADAGPVRGAIEEDIAENGATPAVQTRPTQRVDLRVATLEVVTDEEDAQTPADGAVRLTIRWPAEAVGSLRPFECGERVRVVARLLPPEVYRDPGVWSRRDYLLDQGITSSATVEIARVERLGRAPGLLLPCRIGALQHASSSRLLALPQAMRRLPKFLRLDRDDAIMLAAMATGDRTYLTHSLRVGFERTGSFHMLVISGLHLAIVAGCIFWAARRMRLPRVAATFTTIAASFAYALFTGFATPVQRSLWMVTLYLVGRLFYRERSAMNTIGFAALCLLAASPRSLFDSSFQMTLLAVVAIGGVAAPLLEATIHPYLAACRNLRVMAIDAKLSPGLAQFRVTLRMFASSLQAATGRLFGRWLAWRAFPWTVRFALRVVELIVVSCVIELAMTLPMAMYFHRITLFALPVNLFILPLLVMLMPAALITLALLWIWPPAAALPGMVVALFLHGGVGLVHRLGSSRWGDFRIPAPLAWQSAAFCVLLGAAIVLTRRKRRRLACAGLLLAAVASVLPRAVRHPPDALLVEAIDVGQGDALLLITPDGKTLLVDAGGFGGGPRQVVSEFDVGEEVVSQALWARGIRHLDVVALSHAHSDHMGGMPAILRNFHPDALWVGNNPHFAAYNALLDEAAELGVRTRALHAGDTLALGAAQVRVLAPFADYRPGAEPSNNDSLVLRVALGATSVLLEGDAEAPIEQAMLTEPGLASTLLKVGHHGSVTSTRPEFLARVAPRWAVISCGLHNHYGHPREEVLAALEAAHVRTYSTDIDGIACLRLNGKNIEPENCDLP